MMRRSIVVEEDERAKSNRPCGGNEGLSLVTLTIIARAEAKSCLDYAEPQGGKARFSGIKAEIDSHAIIFRHSKGSACDRESLKK